MLEPDPQWREVQGYASNGCRQRPGVITVVPQALNRRVLAFIFPSTLPQSTKVAIFSCSPLADYAKSFRNLSAAFSPRGLRFLEVRAYPPHQHLDVEARFGNLWKICHFERDDFKRLLFRETQNCADKQNVLAGVKSDHSKINIFANLRFKLFSVICGDSVNSNRFGCDSSLDIRGDFLVDLWTCAICHSHSLNLSRDTLMTAVISVDVFLLSAGA